MRAAITVCQGRVSPVFDVSREAVILDINEQRVASSRQAALANDDPICKSHQLASLGVRTLVCGAISNEALRALSAIGIEVIGFVTGEVQAVVTAFIAGQLPCSAFSMPRCHSQVGGARRRRRRGWGGTQP